MKKAARINECGHPEKRHSAFGLCADCYMKHRYRTNADVREKMKAAARAWPKNNKERANSRTRRQARARAGIRNPTSETRHGDPCEACGEPMTPSNYDHDHITGEHRGWLCAPCNMIAGYDAKGRDRVRSVWAYLCRYYDEL